MIEASFATPSSGRHDTTPEFIASRTVTPVSGERVGESGAVIDWDATQCPGSREASIRLAGPQAETRAQAAIGRADRIEQDARGERAQLEHELGQQRDGRQAAELERDEPRSHSTPSSAYAHASSRTSTQQPSVSPRRRRPATRRQHSSRPPPEAPPGGEARRADPTVSKTGHIRTARTRVRRPSKPTAWRSDSRIWSHHERTPSRRCPL